MRYELLTRILSEICEDYNSRTRARAALRPIFPDAHRQGLSNEPETTPVGLAVVEIRSMRGSRCAMVGERETGASIAGGPNRGCCREKLNRTAAFPPTVGWGSRRCTVPFRSLRQAL